MTKPLCVVFGASGFLGSHILPEFESRGWTVRGTRADSPGENLARFDLRTDRFADLSKSLPNGGRDLRVAVICSAVCQIDRCFREPERSRLINVENTKQLIDDLAERGVRVIFPSTSHALDGEAGDYDEDSPTRPVSEYGRQKVAVENYLQVRPVRSLILRLDKVIGDNPREPHLLSEWEALRTARRPIRCIQGQVLSPTLVDDVARSVAAAADQNLTGLYHVANPEHFERAELARLFLECAGDSLDVTEEPLERFSFADRRPLKTSLNGSRFANATGVEFTSMRSVIRSFLTKCGE